MTSPLFTVVTATFNLIEDGREDYIKQCIESVHNQTYSNIEHIIVDGNSSDGTLEIFKDYPWLKVISEPDSGIYEAMNKGINAANGKYIAFLNSDDFWHDKTGIEEAIFELEKYNADYFFSDTKLIKEESVNDFRLWKGDVLKIAFAEHYCHQGMITRLDVMKELGGFDLAYKISADSDFSLRLCKANKKWVHVEKTYTSYRIGGRSIDEMQARLDHSNSLYEHFSNVLNFSRNECFIIWQDRFLPNMSKFSKQMLIRKYDNTKFTKMIMLQNAKGYSENQYENYLKQKYKKRRFNFIKNILFDTVLLIKRWCKCHYCLL